MKITASSVSVLLAALTPAVLGQWLPPGTLATITFVTSEDVEFTVAGLPSCEPSPLDGPFDATSISIDPKVPGVKCTFYTGEECDGQHYTLGEGDHDLTRLLEVGSYDCAAAE